MEKSATGIRNADITRAESDLPCPPREEAAMAETLIDSDAAPDSVSVSVRGLTKRYFNVAALADVSFDLHHGEIFGLVGPNGAGKTTLLRILATLVPPDSGAAQICGCSIREPAKARSIIGFMPDFLGVYDDMTVREYFEFFSKAYSIPDNLRSFTISETLYTVGLNTMEESVVEGLSRGLKQRLSLGRAILHKPKVLLLDEPASGLDPLARLELREILRSLAVKGVTILISSHVLEDLADICDRVGIINRGCLVCAQNTKKLIHERGGRRIRIQAKARREMLHDELKSRPDVEGLRWDGESLVFLLTGEGDLSQLVRSLVEHGVPLESFYEETPTLETAYLNITRANCQREEVR